MTATQSTLAIHGGPRSVTLDWKPTLQWPIITEEDETAVVDVMRAGTMSRIDLTKEFEAEFADWHDMPHALAHCNGTASLLAAMWACGVGRGDEIIAPSLTYWATALPCYALGASVVFADCDPDTLNIDPADIEHRITDRTKAIVIVHYCAYPCEMDAIMAIAEKHNIKVIEDNSHAQGSLYKGRLCGTLGHVSAMSLMSEKSLVAGECGMLLTRDDKILERAIAWGHYARHADLTESDLEPYKGYPFGGVKNRANQMCSALGRVQLKHYRARMEEILEAMHYFWDTLEGVPGLKAHRPPKDSGSTMGAWYAAKGLYRAEELGGLPIAKFCEAVRAEGAGTSPGANPPMHLHPLLNEADIYGDGKPTRLAFTNRDLRQPPGSLPVTENVINTVYTIPHFKRFHKPVIDQFAAAFRKVAENADQLV
jgi:dTDP-4-amino-4,6-dideoxygalactose transaminase